MKKIIFLLILAFCSLNIAQAKDYTQYCSPKTPQKTFGGTVGSLVGINAVKRNTIEGQIEKALQKKTGAKFDVQAQSFYGINPTSGIFKSLKVAGNNLNYNGLYITSLEADTVCPYNEVQYKDDTLHFVQNSVMKFNAEISQDDLNRMLSETSVAKAIEKINSDGAVSALIKIKSYNIEINDDKLIFNYGISPLPNGGNLLSHLPIKLNDFNVAFSSGLSVKDGQIQLLNFGLNNNQINYGFLLPIVNQFNPTSWGLNLNKNYLEKGQLEIDSVKIKNSKIQIQGAVIAKADI